MGNWKRYMAMLCLSLFALTPAESQDLNFLKFDEGFPNRPVKDLHVDDQGFLWIATFGAGVYKFDGQNYKPLVFDWEDSTSLNSNFVNKILQDDKQRLFIGTEQGLNLLNNDNNTFRRISFEYQGNIFNPAILSLHQDKQGRILVGTVIHGLLVMDSIGQSDVVTLTRGVENFAVEAIAEDDTGNILAATNQGLMQYDFNEGRLFKPVLTSRFKALSYPIQSLFYAGSTLWIGTVNQGLVRVNNLNATDLEVIEYPITSERIMGMVRIKNQIACATENDGLILFDPKLEKPKQYYRQPNQKGALETNSIWTVSVDFNDRLWLGYYNRGIGLFDPESNKFDFLMTEINNPNAINGNSVNGLAESNDGTIWIGMDGVGVYRYFANKKRIEYLIPENGFTGLDDVSVQTIYLDRNDNLWVGTWGAGIFLLKNGQKRFVNFNVSNTSGGLGSNRILSFDEDNDGNIWIATFGARVHYYDQSTRSIHRYVSKQYFELGVTFSNIRDLLIDKSDNLWIGSTNGLFRASVNGLDTLVQPIADLFDRQHPDFNQVLSLFEDQSGNVWVGTDGAGLYRVNETLEKLRSFSDLIDLRSICAITEDGNGGIWASGKSGIVKLDVATNTAVHYSKNDGLLSNDFNYGAILKAADGAVYFGSLEGINMAQPSELKVSDEKVKVFLDELKIFNQVIAPGDQDSPLSVAFESTKEIVLNHDQTVFTIDYTAVNFTDPEQIHFAYYLEGLETNWNYVGNQRSATYTSLKQGDYTFKVKATNNDGRWTDDYSELHIRVLPAWYKSRYALWVYMLLFVVILYLFNVFLKTRLREKQEVINERDRREQNESLTQRKLQFFTNISHEFRTPLTLILNPLAELLAQKDLPVVAQKSLGIVHRNARRMERLIDELMDFRKLNSGKLKIHVHEIDLFQLCSEIIKYFDVEASNKNIELGITKNQEDNMSWVDSGLVEKMLFNLLSNAFKVTPEGGKINIQLDGIRTEMPLLNNASMETICVTIADTGPGLSKEHSEKIFERFYQVEEMNKGYFGGTGIGLEVVKSFIELHKGKIAVESELGVGTAFKLYFPTGNNHFAQEDIVEGEYPGKKEFLVSESRKAVTLESPDPDVKQGKETVLILDDNAELRNYIKSELQNEYQVLAGQNGLEGLQKAENNSPDIIITDVMMPEMDGFEFCEKIKTNVKTSHIPIIMLSAKGSTEDQITGIDKGADVYMTKPFEMTLLKSQIKTLVKSRQMVFDKYFEGISGTAGSNKNATTADRDFMQKMLTFVHEHLSDPQLSVENLAEELALSRSQLYRKIKALTGLKANEFIRKIRLEKARELLTTTDTNVNEVSHKVGFSSPSYFTKCYKELFGILPTQQKDVE